jgi:Zn-dependent protease
VWRRRLNLGTYFRISVYVHWTFAFLVAYVGYSGYQDGLWGTFYSILLLLGMFLCVTLHEYGHALTARRFGIETMDITLFPIGGVARLVKIPRIPWQEFLVAVAGPAVNVVIFLLLGGLLTIVPWFGMPTVEQLIRDEAANEAVVDALDSPSALGFVLSLMVINLALVVFNMIPAFPMDGGRVLRSLLAVVVEYRRATRIASTIGLVCATLMGVTALYFGHPTAGLIAIFIAFAGLSEARQVDALEPIRHLKVRDVMIHSPPRVRSDLQLGELTQALHGSLVAAIPVVDADGYFFGLLTMESVADAVRRGANAETPVGELAWMNVPQVDADESLESVLAIAGQGNRFVAVVNHAGILIGLIDADSVRLRPPELALTRQRPD